MSVIYVTGHRNPDMDSICSAYSYAYLKNLVDKDNEYIPVRLGSVNKNVKDLFNRLDIPIPEMLKDVKARVKDVVKTPKFSVRKNDPIYKVIDIFAKHKPTVLPIYDEEGHYVDLITSDDINAFFLAENNEGRFCYTITEENVEKVIPGRFLKKSGKESINAPLIVGAMEIEQFEKRLAALDLKPVLVTGLRDRHIRKALREGIPGLIIIGISDPEELFGFDFSSFPGFIYLSDLDTADTLRYLRLSTAVKDIVDIENVATEIPSDTLFDEAKYILSNSDERGLSVFESDQWIGYVTRRCFLNKPMQKMILVDHNEVDQSVPGIEDTEIVEIIDHHRLAPPRMRNPIYIFSEPLGSTCTIVYEQFKKHGIPIDKKRAEILLSGIISDTVMLKSPTATSVDRFIVDDLCKIAGVENLQSFSQILFSSGAILADQNPFAVIKSDQKKYQEHGCSFAIGQVEVTSLLEIENLRDTYLEAIENDMNSNGLDWCMLLVTDVIHDTSVLLTTGNDKESRFFWEKLSDRCYLLPGILSRKKQLLPEILRILEEY